MSRISALIRTTALLVALLIPPSLKGAPAPVSGSTHFIFEGNRIYAELVFIRPDGTLHRTLAFVDSGSPAMIVSPGLYEELQIHGGGTVTFQVGELAVHVESSAVAKDDWFPFTVGEKTQVEALLPAGVMERFQVVIDYGAHVLTFAQPGGIKNQGTAVGLRINEKTGLVAIEATVDGQRYPMTIDCGSAYTWLRKSAAKPWLAAHAQWERGTGAVGASNMRMADDGIEENGILLRMPKVQVGALELDQVGALAIGPSKTNWDFIDWYSQKNPSSVIGWLGGNVLRNFRLTLDYPNRVSYWLRQTQADARDLDQVGLTLKFVGGKYLVSALATQKGKPTVEGIQVGDELLQIDEQSTKGATWSAIFSGMHGQPGELRRLRMSRAGKQWTVAAKVTSF